MCGLQLLPGEALDRCSDKMMVAVAEELLKHPGHHTLRWLQKHPEQVRHLWE
jgi:hypothetical protein